MKKKKKGAVGEEKQRNKIEQLNSYFGGGCRQKWSKEIEENRKSSVPKSSKKAKADPRTIQIDGNERRRNGKVVDERVQLQHEPKFVRGGDEANEEVDHEEDVERQIDLLCDVVRPILTSFHIVAVTAGIAAARSVDKVDDQRSDAQQKDEHDLEK